MRQLGQSNNASLFLKFFIITFFLGILTTAAFFILNIDELIFKGPKTVVQLITDSGLKKENNRTNILLLGTGGYGHAGPNLTDTIMLASIDKDAKDIAIVSIPRDLWSPNTNTKINHIYAFGEENGDNGLEDVKEASSILFGIPVHYAVRADFNGFTKAVDLVEGLDIEVENTFTDPKYPITGKEDDLCGFTIETEDREGIQVQVVKDATDSAIALDEINEQNDPFICRYEVLTFNKGSTTMDGATALKFVRSRHGTNGEGSDFARSARQQKTLLAFRQKVLSIETLIKPKTIIDLLKNFGDSIDTDISGEEIPFLAKLFKESDPNGVRHIVLDSGREESVLTVGNPADHGGQYVLVPSIGTWEDLADYVKGEIYILSQQKASQNISP